MKKSIFAVTFLGHASFLTFLKRREFLKPEIAKPYQSVCNRSMPLQPFCLVMNCLNILRRLERSIRYQGRCLAVRLRSEIWSVLTREGLTHLTGATHRGLAESPLFWATEVVEVTFTTDNK